jgi:hypothetical protein
MQTRLVIKNACKKNTKTEITKIRSNAKVAASLALDAVLSTLVPENGHSRRACSESSCTDNIGYHGHLLSGGDGGNHVGSGSCGASRGAQPNCAGHTAADEHVAAATSPMRTVARCCSYVSDADGSTVLQLRLR